MEPVPPLLHFQMHNIITFWYRIRFKNKVSLILVDLEMKFTSIKGWQVNLILFLKLCGTSSTFAFSKNGGTCYTFASSTKIVEQVPPLLKRSFIMNSECKANFQINFIIILTNHLSRINPLLWKMSFEKDIHIIFMVEHLPLSGTCSTITFH